MKLLIFGGTTEGRELSHLLAARGIQVTVCVATPYGSEEEGSGENLTVRQGRLTVEEMERLLRDFDLCVDATHPYAVAATENIRAACAAAGVTCRRLLRPQSPPADAVCVESAAEAAAYLAEREGNILLATGAKEIKAFAQLDPERLYPRVLPSHESLSACEAAGVPHRNILAIQGPFSQELNEAMIRQFRIAWLVTKDGGRAGGFEEKARAAADTGAKLVLLRRPQESGESFDEIVRICEEMM